MFLAKSGRAPILNKVSSRKNFRYFEIAKAGLVVCLIFLAGFTTQVFAQEPGVDFGIEEKLGEFVPQNVEFQNSKGEKVLFGDLVDKPTIVALVYFKCPTICSPLLGELGDIAALLDEVIGIDYQIITVSFDPRETPEDAAFMKKNILTAIELDGKVLDPEGWKFLTGTQESIDTITNSIGFKYIKQDEKDWLHPTGLAVLSKNTKICRYIQGFGFVPADFSLALSYAEKGKVGSTRLAKPEITSNFARIGGEDKSPLQAFCFRVDPVTGQRVLNVTRIFGVIILFTAGCLLVMVTFAGKAASKKKRKLPFADPEKAGENAEKSAV